MSAPAGPANQDQIDYWNAETAQKWLHYQEGLDRIFQAVTDYLVERTQPQPGEAAIDIGCGTGATTLALARRVGPEGRVLGIDVSVPMLERARARVQEAGLGQVTLELSDAQTHAFPAESFDLLASRFGVMFFSEPVEAFANLRRALRGGGRLCALAWAPVPGNPWFEIPRNAAIDRVGTPPPRDPRAPGPLAFAERDYVVDILKDAGFSGCEAVEQQIELVWNGSIEEVATLASNLGPAMRAVKAMGGSQADLDAIAVSVAREFEAFATPQGVTIPANLNVFVARKATRA